MKLPTQQRRALHRIAAQQTREFGVIIEPFAVGAALLRRGLAVQAERWSYARATGVCLRLTEAGRELAAPYVEGIEA